MAVRAVDDAGASPDARPGHVRENAASVLVEREHELDLLFRVLDDLRAGISAAITVRGKPGVGRSALLRCAIERAEDLELTVLSAAGSLIESELPFAMVSQLFDSGAVPEGLACPGLLHTQHEPSRDPSLALRAALFAFARQRPTLLVVDDLQWADHQSQHWLQAVRRRLHEAPLVVLTANTETHPTPADNGEPLHSVAEHVLCPRPLSLAAVGEVLGAKAIAAALSDEIADPVSVATLGNPTVLRAAKERVAVSGSTEVADLAGCLADVRAEQVTRVLDSLPESGHRLLRAIVVCEGRLEFDVVCSVAQLRVESPEIVLDRLRLGGLVAPDDPPRTSDPTVDARVLAAMDTRSRADLYARAARIGHRVAMADEDLARLLLLVEPAAVPGAADVLRSAAGSELAQGRYESARRLLVRARKEPMSAGERAKLLVELASAEVHTAPEASDRLLSEVLDSPGDQGSAPHSHAADLLLARGNSVLMRRMAAVCARSRPSDLDALVSLYWMAADAKEGLPELETWAFPELPETPIDPDQAGVAAWRLALRGQDARRARALARASLTSSRGRRPFMPRIAACKALVLADDVVDADAGLHAVLLDARRARVPAMIAYALLTRTDLALRIGHLDEASRDLSAALEVLPLQSWHPLVRPSVVAHEVVLQVQRGHREAAERAAATDLPAESVEGAGWPHLLFARGALLLAAGRPKRALEHFQECGRRLLSRQWSNPALLPWRSLAAAAQRSDRTNSEVHRLLADELHLAQKWGTPTGIGLAHTGAHQALGETDSAVRAVSILRESPARLRYAEALVHLAETKSPGDGRTTEDLLRNASELALACGADGLTRRIAALSEQRMAEWWVPDTETDEKELSNGEVRIVRLAVRGLANPEIARTLSISRRAVEMHLTNVYRKLGIAGRSELASACARLVEEI